MSAWMKELCGKNDRNRESYPNPIGKVPAKGTEMRINEEICKIGKGAYFTKPNFFEDECCFRC